MPDMEQVPQDEHAAEAEQQPRAERTDDNQAAKVRDWFQPVFGPAPEPSTPSTASPAKPVPTFTPHPAPGQAKPNPSFTPNPAPAQPSPAKPASPAKPVPTFTPNPAPSPAKPAPGVPAGPAKKAPSSGSDPAPAARPNAPVEDAATIVMPVYGAKGAQTGARPDAGHGSASGEIPMLRAVSAGPAKGAQGPARKPVKSETSSGKTRANRAKPHGSSAPPKRVPAPSGRLRSAFRLHKLLIAVLTAIAVIVTTATLVSLRLDASPPPAGAPPMEIPAASKAQVVSLGSGAWPTTPPASVPSSCKQAGLKGTAGASVVSFLDDNSKQRDLVATEAKGLGLIDFSWTSLASPTDLTQSDQFDPSLETELTAADQAAPCGLRFVTLSDNAPALSHSADVRMMTKILTNSSVRQANVLAVAQWMASQPLATGLTIDYENGLPQNLSDLAIAEQVAGWSGLSLDEAVNRLSNDYTQLVGEIADAVHRQHRLVRLMAPVRSSDDVDVATTDIAPYLLNYGALAQYVDQLVLKAYDFSFATGNPGPIAPFTDVANVLTYVHSYGVPWSKLAVAEPLYAYNWTVNNKGGIALSAKGQPISATTLTATQVAAAKKQWKKAKTENGETEYTYVSAGQPHIVWDASSALKTELTWLRRDYPQLGIDAWKIGNADPAGSALAVAILGS
jgi:Glycosyl hydrolases family 18